MYRNIHGNKLGLYVHVAIPLQLVQCTDAVSRINMSAKGCE